MDQCSRAVAGPLEPSVGRPVPEREGLNMNPIHDPKNYSISGMHTGLGVVLLLNLFERLGCGICGPNPLPGRKLITATQTIDPGYCIDSPDAMPAGAMSNFQLPPDGSDDPPMWLAEQQLCERA